MRKFIVLLFLLLSVHQAWSQSGDASRASMNESHEVDAIKFAHADSLSLYYESIGYYAEALDQLNLIPTLELQQLRRKANLYFKLEEMEKAKITLLNEILPRDTIFSDLNLLASIFFQELNLHKSTELRSLLACKYPYNSSNLILLSNLLEMQDSLPQMTKHLDEYLDKFPNSIPIRRQRALNTFKLGLAYESHQDFSIVYSLGDDNPNTLYHYGNLLIRCDSIAKAEIVLEQAASVTKYENPIILLDYAFALNKLNKHSMVHETLNLVDTLLNYNKEYIYNNFSLNELRGTSYFSQKKYKLAAGAFQKALKYRPNDELLIYHLILTEERLGRREALRKWISRYLMALKELPEDKWTPAIKERFAKVGLKQMKLEEEEFMNK